MKPIKAILGIIVLIIMVVIIYMIFKPKNTCSVNADCATGQSCVNNKCSTGKPSGCLQNTDCPIAGQICSNGTCNCSPGQAVCSNSCSNTLSDTSNCGSCGVKCDAGQICSNGSCCQSGQISCSGQCVNSLSDATNCGACGKACAKGEQCINGTCGCIYGQLCSNGCTFVTEDVSNCGQCGNVCPAGQICSNGTCECPAGYSNCIPNGCKVLNRDNSNCGQCGTVCQDPAVCYQGQCLTNNTVGTGIDVSKPTTIFTCSFILPNSDVATYPLVFDNTTGTHYAVSVGFVADPTSGSTQSFISIYYALRNIIVNPIITPNQSTQLTITTNRVSGAVNFNIMINGGTPMTYKQSISTIPSGSLTIYTPANAVIPPGGSPSATSYITGLPTVTN